jgi:NAD-dependent SIR2 family protein deacetylase
MINQFNAEYKCIQCGHNFSRTPWMDKSVQCPCCGGDQLENNPYLLGTCCAEGLTDEDYYAVALKP